MRNGVCGGDHINTGGDDVHHEIADELPLDVLKRIYTELLQGAES